MKKMENFIMKVKKIFHKDPESLRLKEEKERQRRHEELQEIRRMVAEYERRMREEENSEKVEPLSWRETEESQER